MKYSQNWVTSVRRLSISLFPLSHQVVQSVLGAVVNVLISTLMGQSNSAVAVFSRDRPLFLREYSTDHYNIIPYFLSKLGSEAFNSFLAVFTQAVLVYWMMGFQMGFGSFLAITYSLALTATAVAVMLGACFSDPKFATALFTVVVIPQMYFSGVFIAIDLLPKWVAWAQYLCSLTYASRLSFAYEFGNCKAGPAGMNCQTALDSNNVSLDDTWWVSRPYGICAPCLAMGSPFPRFLFPLVLARTRRVVSFVPHRRDPDSAFES